MARAVDSGSIAPLMVTFTTGPPAPAARLVELVELVGMENGTQSGLLGK
jgi:hypothetical protein